MKLFDAILRVTFGHNAVDNTKDWHQAHTKAQTSRQELQQTIEEAELLEKAKSHVDNQLRKDNSNESNRKTTN